MAETILKYNNISIAYETFGESNNQCVILIMGITGQLISWPVEIAQGLADKGFYVIRFDNRDVGLSSYYNHLESPSIAEAVAIKQRGETFVPPYSLNDMALDIVTLMDGLGIAKSHIVGISMGGQIAQIFALEHKERILSLTCIATSSGDYGLPPPSPTVMAYFFDSPSPVITDLNSYLNSRLTLHKVYNPAPEDMDEETAIAIYRQSYLRAYHPSGNHRQLLAMIAATPRGDQLRKLRIPSLIIHGDSDPAVSVEHAQQLAQCLENSQLVIIENMGHGLPQRIYTYLVNLLSKHFNNLD